MFEVKYTRDGAPIREKSVIDQMDAQPAEQVEAPAEMDQPEVDMVEQVEEVEQPELTAPTPTQQPKSNDKADNFRELRAKADRIERERDEAVRRLQELEYKSRQPAETVGEEDAVAPDDLVEGKHLSKYDKKIRNLEQQLEQYQKQSAEVTVETKLKSQYADFDQVVNADNIEKLRNMYPEIAQTLMSSNDLYSKAVSAYTMIKKLGIKPEDTFIDDKNRAIRNAAKPRPLASVSPQQGDSPLSKANAFANGLTPALQEELRKEMFEAMKNR